MTEEGEAARTATPSDVTRMMTSRVGWLTAEKIINVEDAPSVKELTPRHPPHPRTRPVVSLFEANKDGRRGGVIINSTTPSTNDN